MIAGLQRHIEGGPFGQITRLVECERLGMRLPHSMMCPFAHYLAGDVDHDGTHTRVWMCPMVGGELDGPSHVAGMTHSAARH